MTERTASSGRAPQRRRQSISRRLLTGALLALVCSITAGLILTFELVLVNERSSLDRLLREQATHFELDVADNVRSIEFSTTDLAPVVNAVEAFIDRESPNQPILTVVRVDDTEFVGATSDEDLNDLAVRRAIAGPSSGEIATIHTDEGDLRALRTPIVIGDTTVGELLVAGSMAPVRAEAFNAIWRLTLVGGASLAIGLTLMWVAIRRVVSPLSRLRDAVAETDPEVLGRRVEVEGDDEIAEVATEFNTLLDRLNEADAEREELLATIAHELRTPLAVASGRLEMARATLSRSPSDDDISILRDLGVVDAELARSSRLVTDLLALGRSGHADFIDRRPTSLRQLTDDIEIRVDGQGFDMVSVEPGPTTSANLDTERILQAVLNCVGNAIHHNPPGTSVDVRCRQDKSDVVIEIVDDGVGIPEADRARVVEPFVSLTAAPTTSHGSGLGLAVVSAVVKAHDGELWIGPGDEGQGLTVALRFPADPGTP